MHDQLAEVPKATTNGKLDERKIKENCLSQTLSVVFVSDSRSIADGFTIGFVV